jgi:hypothetical protein
MVVKLSTCLHSVPGLSTSGAVRLRLHIVVLIYEFNLFYLYLNNRQQKPVLKQSFCGLIAEEYSWYFVSYDTRVLWLQMKQRRSEYDRRT